MDAPIAPGGVLVGQAQDQRAEACGDGGAAAGRRGGPAAADELAVPAQDRRGRDQQSESATGGSSRARAAMTARSVQWSVVVGCGVAAQPVDGAGRGSRSLWRCRSGRAAPSSSTASRTSDRSASAPPLDHPGPPSATNRQVNGYVRSFGHPQGSSCFAVFWRVGARNSAHLMRPADTRASGRQAGRIVGRRGSRLWRGERVVGKRPGQARSVDDGRGSAARTADSTAAACRWLKIRMRSRTSRRMPPTKGSAIKLARGARTGVLMIQTSIAVNTGVDLDVFGHVGSGAPRQPVQHTAEREVCASTRHDERSCWVACERIWSELGGRNGFGLRLIVPRPDVGVGSCSPQTSCPRRSRVLLQGGPVGISGQPNGPGTSDATAATLASLATAWEMRPRGSAIPAASPGV